jgi:hypothetical protein
MSATNISAEAVWVTHERDMLRAVLDAAGYQDIDRLLSFGKMGDARRLGELAKERTLEVIARATKAEARIAELEAALHVGNEWADMACNGVQWLRNIRDGISSADSALVEMEWNLSRIRNLTTGAKP